MYFVELGKTQAWCKTFDISFSMDSWVPLPRVREDLLPSSDTVTGISEAEISPDLLSYQTQW